MQIATASDFFYGTKCLRVSAAVHSAAPVPRWPIDPDNKSPLG